MSVEFRIEGLDDLEKQFDRLIDTSKKATMRKALNAGIAPINRVSGNISSELVGNNLHSLRYSLL